MEHQLPLRLSPLTTLTKGERWAVERALEVNNLNYVVYWSQVSESNCFLEWNLWRSTRMLHFYSQSSSNFFTTSTILEIYWRPLPSTRCSPIRPDWSNLSPLQMFASMSFKLQESFSYTLLLKLSHRKKSGGVNLVIWQGSIECLQTLRFSSPSFWKYKLCFFRNFSLGTQGFFEQNIHWMPFECL